MNTTQNFRAGMIISAVFFVGMLAIGMMVYQFICREGLWYDELCLAHNFIARDFYGLFRPLDIVQIAPIMFLLIEKLMLNLSSFNDSLADYSLRIYPLCCGMGVVILYYPLIRNITRSRIIALFAYVLLVLNPVFIYYTSEVKQYICELFYAVLLLYFWSKPRSKWHLKQCLLIIVLATLEIWNSHTVCFIILPMALWDGWELFKANKYNIINLVFSKQLRSYIFQYGVILLIFLEYYLIFLYKHPMQSYMINFWANLYDAFITRSNVTTLINRNILFYYGKIPMVFFILGLLSLFFLKNKFPALFACCIIGVHSFFSYFHIYPVLERFIFYWMVIIPLLLSCLLYRILYINKSLIYINALICTFIIAIIEMVRISLPVYIYTDNDYPRSALKFISENYVLGETILHKPYLYPNAYIEKYYLLNIDKNDMVSMKYEKDVWSSLREQRLKKNYMDRLWLLYPSKMSNKIINDIWWFIRENDDQFLLNCGIFNVEMVCLLEKKYIEPQVSPADISIQDTNGLTKFSDID